MRSPVPGEGAVAVSCRSRRPPSHPLSPRPRFPREFSKLLSMDLFRRETKWIEERRRRFPVGHTRFSCGQTVLGLGCIGRGVVVHCRRVSPGRRYTRRVVSPLGIPGRLPFTTEPKIRASIRTPPLGNEVCAAHRDWERRHSRVRSAKGGAGSANTRNGNASSRSDETGSATRSGPSVRRPAGCVSPSSTMKETSLDGATQSTTCVLAAAPTRSATASTRGLKYSRSPVFLMNEEEESGWQRDQAGTGGLIARVAERGTPN